LPSPAPAATLVSERRADHDIRQEYRIVALAAQGQSNREIAARLFLSHRTVGYHLYKAYPKLGVSLRTELAALIAGQAR
jgi:DNA-binding CsgD family transcriptional regulator